MNKILKDAEEILNDENLTLEKLKEQYKSLIRKYKRIDSRLEKIVKMSDKEQKRSMVENEYLDEMNRYHVEEQQKAHKKQKAIIVNDFSEDENFNVKVVYKASDILSGDSYSIYKTSDGGILIYILDAMGHGILPSLTSFSVASTVKQFVKDAKDLKDLSNKILPNLKATLIDSEQLSCAFIWICKDFGSLEYFISGMYPQLLKDSKGIHRLKSNNIPLMSFMNDIKVTKMEIDGFEKIFLYTDGLLEESEELISPSNIEEILECKKLEEILKIIENQELEDDVTFISFAKKD